MDVEKYLSKLTPAERAYFIACTDIYHDQPYSVDGRPSMSKQLQNTVVFNTERNVTQADFTNVTPGNQWDLNLVSLPFITRRIFRGTNDTGDAVNFVAAPSSFVTQLGGITMFGANSGTPTADPNSAAISAATTLTVDDLIYPPGTTDTLRTFYEILAMGYEVYNVTPDLYVGGSLVRYRVPTQARKENVVVLGGTTPFVNVEANMLPPIPTTESLATQYPDSVIDEARSGTYQQHCIQDAVSDFHAAGNQSILMTATSLPAVPGAVNCLMTSSSFSWQDEFPTFAGDFDVIGTYFSGLPPQTNLKVRARYILSTVPNSTNAQLVSLAKMSPPDNPKLTQLVSYIQNRLPPGVSVKMNPAGEWWRIVGKIVAKASPVIGAEFGPQGKKAGEIVGKIAQQATQKPKKKKAAAAKPMPSPKPKGK